MAKSKYAPALFEVINRQKNTGNLGVPKWWKGGQGPQPDEAAPEPGVAPAAAPATTEQKPAIQDLRIAAESVSPQPVAQVTAPAKPKPLTLAAAEETAPAADREENPVAGRFPGVRVDSRRLHLVLTPMHAAVACGAILIVMLGFYQIGRSTGGKTPVAGDDSMTNLLGTGPAGSAAVDQPAGSKTPTPPAKATAGPSTPIRAEATGTTMPKPSASDAEDLKIGLRYVALDTYPPDALKTAQHVQKWLAEKHQIQTVLRQRKGKYWLISKTSFDFSVGEDKQKCAQYVERIKSLGKECRSELIRAVLPVYNLSDPFPFLLQP